MPYYVFREATSTSRRASTDLRVQRTRRVIQEALIELTIQKGFAAVTVRGITRHAQVNRATFSRHFQDKFDLLDQYAEEVYRLLEAPAEAELWATRKSGAADNSATGLIRMFEHIRTYAKFYQVMLGQHGDPAFAERIRQYVRKRMRRSLSEALGLDQRSVDLCLSYIASGSVGVVMWWLEHDMPYAPAEMAAVAQRLGRSDLTADHRDKLKP